MEEGAKGGGGECRGHPVGDSEGKNTAPTQINSSSSPSNLTAAEVTGMRIMDILLGDGNGTDEREEYAQANTSTNPRKRPRLSPETTSQRGATTLDKHRTEQEVEVLEALSERFLLDIDPLDLENTSPTRHCIGKLALNAVTVLARAASNKDTTEDGNACVSEDIDQLHQMNEALVRECRTLRHEMLQVQNGIQQLKVHNEKLRIELAGFEAKAQCQICFQENRNVVLMPCLHFLFCKFCMDSHFKCSASGARICPLCRKGVSGVLVIQLDQ